MATQPISNLVTTWNAAGTTFTAVKMNVTDTASASGSLLMDLQVGGSSRFNVRKDGVVQTLNVYATGSLGYALFNDNGLSLNSSARIGFTATGSAQNAQDLQLHRDAANTLAQRNGTNAQVQHVYATYTDASNYERLKVGYSSSAFRVQAEKAGTGAARSLVLGTNGTDRWTLDGSSGHFLAAADNTYDIGANGANRPRAIYLASTGDAITSAGDIRLASSSQVYWVNRGGIRALSDGVIGLYNNAATDFSRLQFGGTTSSFPALKRNGAVLQIRLADDSSSADFTAAQITANASTAMPAGGAVTAGVRMSTTANFGVFFGSGAPTLSAAKGSLYLRSDGTTTNDRAYINTDGATTWTALTTAA